jgi:subtilisin family serine protease
MAESRNGEFMDRKPNLRSVLKNLKAWQWAVAVFVVLAGFSAIGNSPLKGLVRRGKKPVLTAELFRNWGLANTRAKSHISALDAWNLEEGDSSILVAVIDTGLDSHHPDLKSNVFRDENKAYGWNFVSNTPNPADDHGHGTHVAGILGAQFNPRTGTAGVAQKVSIMAVKYYSDANPGSINLKNTVKAIEYAVQKGAKIINYSGGGPEFSEEEYLAIKKAEAKGVLFVAAAGNERQDTDLQENYYYPSAYRLSNILSVAATDINNNLLKSSNWGRTRVDVAAPGENIYSTLPGGRYGYMSGTSQATAFVTGMAALMLAKDPSLRPAQIKEIIRRSVDPIPGLQLKVASGGRVNAYRALLAVGVELKSPSVPSLRKLAKNPLSFLDFFSKESEVF